MVPISHREGDYIATAGAPTDALQEVIPITVRRKDDKVVIETTWRPGPGSTAADLNAAMVDAVRKAKQWAVACGIGAPEADVHPLHDRARVAIGRLGLDGSRLELAVAVFGWGSDEANGSLLGLARAAWSRQDLWVRRLSGPGSLRWEVCKGPIVLSFCETEADAITAAIESASLVAPKLEADR